MSRRESEVGYIDTMSSGDSNNKSKQTPKAKEVNNNEVDELSKELSEMGCIVDAMKRPPNICVENCVYESDSDESQKQDDAPDEDGYSDEFEEDEEESQSAPTEKSSNIDSRVSQSNTAVKTINSQSSVSSHKPPSISGKSARTDFGSVSVPSTRRVNMSFSNDRMREIERHNHILLTKILSARNSRKSSIPGREQPLSRRPLPAAAVTRKIHQRQIDHDNMLLLKKIQRAKSSSYSVRR